MEIAEVQEMMKNDEVFKQIRASAKSSPNINSYQRIGHLRSVMSTNMNCEIATFLNNYGAHIHAVEYL